MSKSSTVEKGSSPSPLLSLSDVRENFDNLKRTLLTRFSLYTAFEPNFDDDLHKVLKDVGVVLKQYDSSVIGCLGKDPSMCSFEILEIDDQDGEKEMCIKSIVLMYMFVLGISVHEYHQEFEWNSVPPLRLFMHYVEEKVLTKFFDHSKKYNQPLTEPNMETGVESLETWQHFILHIYVRIHSDIIKLNTGIQGFTDCPPYCAMLTLSKYFCEKKNKFMNENPGKFWKKSTIESFLLHNHFVYWTGLIEEVYKRAPLTRIISKVKSKLDIFANQHILMNCFYSLSELTSSKKEGNSLSVVTKIITRACQACPAHYASLTKLMSEDYEQVKNTKDSTILSEIENSRNYGKYAWVIKHKILTIVSELSNYALYYMSETTYLNIVKQYFDLITDTLQNESEIQSRSLLGQQAIISAFNSISLYSSDNILAEEFTYHRIKVLNICKKLITCKNWRLRRLTNTMLSKFFVETNYYEEELFNQIIASHELITDDMIDFCQLLHIASRSLTNIHRNPSKSVKESFSALVYKLFETICLDEDMKYMKDYETIKTKEKKIELHNKIVKTIFLLLGETYNLIKNSVNLEVVLTAIKKQTEQTVDRNEMFPTFAIALEQFFETNIIDDIVKILDKLNYYPFIVKFIELYIEEGKQDNVMAVGPVFSLIGTMSDIGILHNKFTIEMVNSNNRKILNKNGPNSHFLYDFIMPKVIKGVKLPIDEIGKISSHWKDNFYMFLVKIDMAYSAWSRILLNDIALTGGDKSHDILEKSFDQIEADLVWLFEVDLGDNEEYKRDILSNAINIMLLFRNRAEISTFVVDNIQEIYPVFKVGNMGSTNTLPALLEIMEHGIETGAVRVDSMIQMWVMDLIEIILDNSYLRSLIQRVNFLIQMELLEQSRAPTDSSDSDDDE